MNKKLLIARKRKQRDLNKLCQTGFKVELSQDNVNEAFIEFHGPKDSLYQGGIWKILIHLPQEYPYKSPSIGFMNKIFHPNIDFASGSICLDVINQTWSPMYELVNIFEQFLPQLLSYPNPSDPLNIEAANLLNRSQKDYENYVKDMVNLYSLKKNIDKNKNQVENRLHRASTECELLEMSCEFSDASQLSDLSDTSGIFFEEEIFQQLILIQFKNVIIIHDKKYKKILFQIKFFQ